jgi:hypothetical protein
MSVRVDAIRRPLSRSGERPSASLAAINSRYAASGPRRAIVAATRDCSAAVGANAFMRGGGGPEEGANVERADGDAW